MKTKYFTTNEIFNIETAIYNDDNKTLLSLLPDTLEEPCKKSVEELVGAVEWTVIIPGIPYILTKDCRVFNIKFNREMKLSYTPHCLSISLRNTYYKLPPFFKKLGWKYDHKKAVETAFSNDKLIVAPMYKYLFLKPNYLFRNI